MQRIDGCHCRVRVVDAVGVVATETLVLEVQPKIPPTHLVYLLEQTSVVPSLDVDPASLAPDSSLFEFVARWYVRRLHHLLLDGLARGYREERDEVSAVRGRVIPLATANHYYRGRMSVVAEFEEFDFDTPLNRLLLHAARIVVGSTLLPEDLRRSARGATAHLDGVGRFVQGEFSAEPDRRTSHYRDAVLLAKQIIRGTGRTLLRGGEPVWTFLIRTPEAVEDGLRNLLWHYMPASLRPIKRRTGVGGASMTLNPDLVWGHTWAIGDVKYKLAVDEWRRPDLYEIVAFATGFRVSAALLLEFGRPGQRSLPTVDVGDVRVSQLLWPADASLSPDEAVALLSRGVERWANEITRPVFSGLEGFSRSSDTTN